MTFTSEHFSARKVATASWLLLLALQPFNQFGALRQISALVLTLSMFPLVWSCAKGVRFSAYLRDPMVSLGFLIALWITACSVLGPYPADSLNAMRKEFFVQALMFGSGLMLVRNLQDLGRAMAWVLAGFAALTVLSSGEILAYWRANGLTIEIPRTHRSWWGGYAAAAACMVTLLAGWLLMPARRRPELLVGAILGLAGIGLTILYLSRTPVVVLFLGVALVLFLARRWTWLAGWACAVSLLAALSFSNALAEFSPHWGRYQSLTSSKTYVSNEGLSLRPALWQGMVELIEDRPASGYGYGWKKLAWAINEGGYAEKWRSEGGPKAAYFLNPDGLASYGRVNPHNYFLQVAFEIGLPGLALVLAWWAVLVGRALGMLRSAGGDGRAMAVAVLGLVTAYWVSNLTNGHWQGGLANVTLALLAGLISVGRHADSPK